MDRKIVNTFVFILFLFFGVKSGFSQIPSFEETLSKSGMLFEMPSGYEEVSVIDNNSMKYSFAMKNKEAGIEVRYRIDLIDTNDPHGGSQDDGMTALTVLYNISDKSMPLPELAKRLMVINKEQASRDFNADAVFVSFLKPGEAFGQKYKNCGMSLLTKEGVAKTWVFLLFDDGDSFRQHGQKVTTALKFSE